MAENNRIMLPRHRGSLVIGIVTVAIIVAVSVRYVIGPKSSTGPELGSEERNMRIHDRVAQLTWSMSAYDENEQPRFPIIDLSEYVDTDASVDVFDLVLLGKAKPSVESLPLKRELPEISPPLLFVGAGVIVGKEIKQSIEASMHPNGVFVEFLLDGKESGYYLLASRGKVSYPATPWPPVGTDWVPPDTSHLWGDHVLRMPVFKDEFDDGYAFYVGDGTVFVDRTTWKSVSSKHALPNWYDLWSIIVQ